jgi:NADPH2:quinone reductase
MKAIRVESHGGPEVLKLVEIPTPEPADGQVLIRVEAVGINPVETYIRNGGYIPVQLPYTPGSDAAGIVEKVGPGTKRFKPGARVYTTSTITGSYAEFTLCNETTVFPLPQITSFAQGAALGVPYATAYKALFHRGRAMPGETVLIHGGSGGVGTAAIQFARAAGLIVFATSSTDQGRELVIKNGAHLALNHASDSYLEELKRITNGNGVNLIIEMLSNVNLGRDLTVLAKFGRVVVVGSRGKVEINPRDAMSRDASILAMTLFNSDLHDIQSIHAAIYAGLENKSLSPVIGKEFSLGEARQAQEEVMKSGAHGKIVLVLGK